MGITFRFFTEGDVDAITQFNKDLSGEGFSPSYWRWKYLQNPAGAATVALASDGSRIVGSLGVQRVRIKVGSKEITAGHVVDIKILDEYRKDGLLYFLAKHAYEEFIDSKKGEMLFGFGPEVTTKLATKFSGFYEVGPVNKMVKIVDPTPQINNKMKVPFVGNLAGAVMRNYIITREKLRAKRDGLSIHEVQECDSRFDALWSQAAKKEIMIIRDCNYLTWRYVECPVTHYKILAAEKDNVLQGYIIIYTIKKNGLTRGIIADFAILPGAAESGEILFARAILYLYSKGAVIVSSWFPKDTFVSPVLKRIAFVKRPSYNYLVARSLTEGISQEFIRDEDNWYYTIGDSDWVGRE